MRYNIDMDESIVKKLTAISEEERKILDFHAGINQSNYTASREFIIYSERFLTRNKQIDLRIHTRFTDFPRHGHNYLEVMYVYHGKIVHHIRGERIELKQGDILFINRHVLHDIEKAELDDIGINFILGDDFLRSILPNIEKDNVLKAFVEETFKTQGLGQYLHFRIGDIYPIRNLLDNLIFSIIEKTAYDELILKQTVALLFSYLSFHKESRLNPVEQPSKIDQYTQAIELYIKQSYKRASLQELSNQLDLSLAYLSRFIQHHFHHSFKALLLEQRLLISEHLLTNSDLDIHHIIQAVGYENQSYFFNRFKEKYGTSPLKYRANRRQT